MTTEPLLDIASRLAQFVRERTGCNGCHGDEFCERCGLLHEYRCYLAAEIKRELQEQERCA